MRIPEHRVKEIHNKKYNYTLYCVQRKFMLFYFIPIWTYVTEPFGPVGDRVVKSFDSRHEAQKWINNLEIRHVHRL